LDAGVFGPTFQFRIIPAPGGPATVPEFAGLTVPGLGLAGLLGCGWKRRRASASGAKNCKPPARHVAGGFAVSLPSLP
jgi:hypothetical protein